MNDASSPLDSDNGSSNLPDKAAKSPIVVGIGASAGGVEAFESFFSHLSPSMGMAFVLIQHLAPDHASILADIIQRYTQMPVQQVKSDMSVVANQVYVIPPNKMMGLLNGRLQLLQPAEGASIRLPIDYFFRSLAADMRERAIGIILSGTASDGTLGLKAIKEQGGMIMVQDPATTTYDGMPRNAISTGLVDFILSPADMPSQLEQYRRLAFDSHMNWNTSPSPSASDSLHKILMIVRSQTGQDYSQYKESTIRRRIARLMAVNQIEKLDDYVHFLQNNPIGVEALFRDMLIGVTSFFRDIDVFTSLRDTVIPKLFENRRGNQPIRIWIAGCSTGEEAYSIAILLREQMAFLKQEFRVQIFATDIDAQAVNIARAGVYPSNIAVDVPDQYLTQYFLEIPEGYQVTKSLREMLIFAVHSVTQDPPFSRLDLISCRNLLIYLDTELQYKVLSYFHFALAPTGFLMLGLSESLGKNDREFRIHDLQHKLFQRSSNSSLSRFTLDLPSVSPDLSENKLQTLNRGRSAPSLREATETMLLKDWSPACVIINQQGLIRYVHGRTGKYLEIATGDTHELDIIHSAREGLKVPLTTTIYRAITQQREIFEPTLRIDSNGQSTYINLIVKPFTATTNENLLAVFFVEIDYTPQSVNGDSETPVITLDEREQKSRVLQQELTDTREYLQAIIEELKSSNEEMQSMNEELQSVNEELETSQEELKAVNEELLTTNSELERKVEEVTWANNDLQNILNTVQTGIIILDADAQVRRFNPAAAKVFKLIEGDVGRSIAHIVSDLHYPELLHDIQVVFSTLIPHEIDIQSQNGHWYAIQIRPYRTVQNAIKGVIVSFNDVTTQKKTDASEEARLLAEEIFNTVREPLVLINKQLYVVNANSAFFQLMNVTPEETLGVPLSELGDDAWNIPGLTPLIKNVFETGHPLEAYEISINLPSLEMKRILVSARRLLLRSNQSLLVLLALGKADL